MSRSSVRKRMRLTLILGALATAVFGVIYGVVANQAIPQQSTVSVASIQTAASTVTTTNQVTVNSGSESKTTATPAPTPAATPVVHTQTRAS